MVIQTNNISRPYATDIVALRFGSCDRLRIPRQFLDKTPLAARLERSEPPNEINLEHIGFEAGHVIVNFLVTGKYQCLEPLESTAAGKHSSDFRTALHVYTAADELGLTRLFKIAQEEVKKAGDKLDFLKVVDNVHFLDPFHAHLPWIGEYVQSRMMSFWENTTVEQATKMTSDVSGPSNLHKILIDGLLKMKVSGLQREREPKTDPIIKMNPTAEDMRKMIREEREKLSALASRAVLASSMHAKDLRSKEPEIRGPNPQPDQPHPCMPQAALVPEISLPAPPKSIKKVEDEAASEEAELRALFHKTRARLGFSCTEQKRWDFLQINRKKRSEVLGAKWTWCQLEHRDEEADTAFREAVSNGE